MQFRKPAAVATGLVLLFSGFAFSQPPNLYTFNPDVKITDAPPTDGTSIFFQSSGQHFTAFRGDTVYVAWWESRNSYPPPGSHVFFAKSTDAGQSFAPAVRVNSLPTGLNPSMWVDSNGIVYVAYQRQGNIYFTKSTDGGTTFTPSILVVDPAGLDSLQERPSIAVNNRGHVYIAWIDERTDPGSISTAASYDGGQSFGSNVRASGTYATGLSGFDIGTDDSGRLYVVLTSSSDPSLPNKFPLYLSRSDDSGQTFQLRGMVTDLPTDTALAWGINPSVTVGDGLIGVVWEDARSSQPNSIRFSGSSDLGETFSSSRRVTVALPDCPAGNRFPSVGFRKGIFYVAWNDISIRSSDSFCIFQNIFFSYSPDRGQTFAPPLGADTTGRSLAGTVNSSLAVNEQGKVFVAWIDNRYDLTFQEIWRIFGAAALPHFIKGDLNLDGKLSPADMAMELNAVYLGRSFPAPFESADGNCDSELTPADVALQINAVFVRMPFPCF